MTEQDAREKVCPFMVDYTFQANDCIATVYKKCCTYGCMAWNQYRGDGWCMRIIQGKEVMRDDT